MVEEILSIINKAYKRQKRYQIIICLFIIMFGTAMILTVFSSITVANHNFILVIGALLILVGIILFVGVLLRKKNTTEDLFQILKNEPGKIVWIYHYVVQTMPYGVATNKMITIYFCLINGEKLGIKANIKETATLLDKLKILLPTTTFGYSRDKDQLYEVNPFLLKKEV